MTMTGDDTLTVQFERLRGILIRLEVVRAGEHHDELIERARVAVAAIRRTRDTLGRQRRREAAE
jgi:hypothetical protein